MQPILRQGSWWATGPDGTWFRWDAGARVWAQQAAPPPPPAPGEAASASAAGYRTPEKVGTALVLMLIGAVTLDLIAALSDLASYSLFTRASAAGFLSPTEATSADLRQGLIALGQLGMLLATGILFIVWFHRCHKNLPPLGAQGLRFTSGWAIGAWFVPILNLFRPKQIADEIWKASSPDTPPDQGEAWKVSKVPAFLTLWWVAWLVSGIVGQVAGGFTSGAQTLDQLAQGTAVVAVSDILAAITGVLAAAVVATTTNRQRDRAERLQSQQATLQTAVAG